MGRENDIMNDDGVQKVILTYDNTFLNADSLFIEFDDVINSPFFIFLYNIKNNEAFNEIFDTSEISDYSVEELYEWYLNRKNKNVLWNIPLNDYVMEKIFKNDDSVFCEWCEEFLYKELDAIPGLIEQNTELNFYNILKMLLGKKIVKEIYIYTEYYSNTVKDYIEKNFNSNIKYVSGNMQDVIKEEKITSNSTFVFSDITKIYELKDAGILNLSSVIIADRYAYNYVDEENPCIELDELYEKDVIKLDFFNNIEKLEDIDEEEI